MSNTEQEQLEDDKEIEGYRLALKHFFDMKEEYGVIEL